MDSNLFDMHILWLEILEKSNETDDKSPAGFPEYLEKTYPDEPNLEDLTFYKDYLSKFVLSGDLYGKEFLNDSDLSYDECLLLLRLAAASFSSTYELSYLKDEDKLELTINVTSKGQSITKKLQELWSFQIMSLFRIYLNEQLQYEFLVASGEKDIEGQRNKQLSIFERQMAQCINKMHDLSTGRDGGTIIEDALDELLNS